MTKAQYIKHLGELYASDGWTRRKADQWIAGPEGKALHERGNWAGDIKAPGVDEALVVGGGAERQLLLNWLRHTTGLPSEVRLRVLGHRLGRHVGR